MEFPFLPGWDFGEGADPGFRDDQLQSALIWKDRNGLKLFRIGEPSAAYFRLEFAPGMAFDVMASARRVINRSTAELPPSTIQHLLADQIMPRVLAHEGTMVVHAAAIAVGGEALALMGDTGSGKSTLAASFAKSPSALLGDDASIVTFDDGGPRIRSVYPSLRLFPDSIAALFADAPTSTSMAHYTAKRRLDAPVRLHDNEALPLAALFVLAPPPEGGGIECRPMSSAEACMTIVQNSFALDPTDLDRARHNMTDASRIANSLPAYLLSYPRDYSRLPEVRTAVMEHFENRL